MLFLWQKAQETTFFNWHYLIHASGYYVDSMARKHKELLFQLTLFFFHASLAFLFLFIESKSYKQVFAL